MPKVYNLRDKHKTPIPRDAVYCGRGSPYGNPFIAGTHGSRETVIRKFIEQVLPDLDVSALRGKDLVCWCAPLACHCDAIMEKANMLPDGLIESDGRYYYECKSCGELDEFLSDPENFELGHWSNKCGRSPWCIP